MVLERLGHIAPEYWDEAGLVPEPHGEGGVCLLHLDTWDVQAFGEISMLLGEVPETRPCKDEEFQAALEALGGGNDRTAAELIAGLSADEDGWSDDLPEHDLEALANQAPVVRLVNLLLSEALEAEASDVHIEATPSGTVVRYRIDGVLQEGPAPPGRMRAAIVSRLKIMAELDIAERRRPQDGRIRLRLGDQEVDVRVSTLPTLHGESVVLRLLLSGTSLMQLSGLGMGEGVLAAITSYCRRPHGILLATGPTGSGKTTTLYAIVQQLRTGQEKIIAVEDPVEYDLPGTAQVPVRPSIGLTFAHALRSILRQDPDVLLVGEMRDAETAEICVQAALTGHLVLSTLHTNDAPGALARLLNLGVPAYLIAATLDAVLAQRLVRRVCDACAVVVKPDDQVGAEMEQAGFTASEVREGTGCSACRGTGYRGRTGIYQLLQLTPELVDAVLRSPDERTLGQLAASQGLSSLRADGWRQVALGVTTPHEVLRVTA